MQFDKLRLHITSCPSWWCGIVLKFMKWSQETRFGSHIDFLNTFDWIRWNLISFRRLRCDWNNRKWIVKGVKENIRNRSIREGIQTARCDNMTSAEPLSCGDSPETTAKMEKEFHIVRNMLHLRREIVWSSVERSTFQFCLAMIRERNHSMKMQGSWPVQEVQPIPPWVWSTSVMLLLSFRIATDIDSFGLRKPYCFLIRWAKMMEFGSIRGVQIYKWLIHCHHSNRRAAVCDAEISGSTLKFSGSILIEGWNLFIGWVHKSQIHTNDCDIQCQSERSEFESQTAASRSGNTKTTRSENLRAVTFSICDGNLLPMLRKSTWGCQFWLTMCLIQWVCFE
jgi:hypothetical protein